MERFSSRFGATVVVLLFLGFVGWSAHVLVTVSGLRRTLEGKVGYLITLQKLQASEGDPETFRNAVIRLPGLGAELSDEADAHAFARTLSAIEIQHRPASKDIDRLVRTLRAQNRDISVQLGDWWTTISAILFLAICIALWAVTLFFKGRRASAIIRKNETQRLLYERGEASRQDLRAVLERLPLGVAVVSDDRVRFANGVFGKLVGAAPDALLEREIKELLPLSAEQQGTPEELTDIELPNKMRGALRVLPSINFEGTRAQLHLIRPLPRAQEAKVSDRLSSVGTLAAGVAHEINNPLAYILTNLEYIKELLERPEGQSKDPSLKMDMVSALSDALDGVERVKGIVRDMRVLSSPEGKSERLDVHALLDSSIKLIWGPLEQRARVIRAYGRIEPVLANPARLSQVFISVLLNAAQAIPEGHPDEHEIRVRSFSGPQGRANVEIEDTGGGIPENIIARIFDPFFTTKNVGEGVGMGLFVSHQILESMGAEIMVESEEGVGTNVRISLQP